MFFKIVDNVESYMNSIKPFNDVYDQWMQILNNEKYTDHADENWFTIVKNENIQHSELDLHNWCLKNCLGKYATSCSTNVHDWEMVFHFEKLSDLIQFKIIFFNNM